MRKTIVAIAACALLAIAGLYLGSPYWAAYTLEQAAKNGDADTIDMLADMPQIREGLKSQISAVLAAKLNTDPDIKGNPFAALGALIAPALVGKVIDAYVTPEGIARILKNGKPTAQTPDAAVPAPHFTAQDDYLGLDRFRVRLHDTTADRAGPSLLFERRGFVTWKLIRIELPADAFANTPATPDI
ncbi:DUF2939 domain-containing protein [Novosphingobium sp.]|uniref:DUF2939 domain-containing protein n=1 Tax=Novosphingobium sp. TaxID=1874826 RepID=UPI003B51EC4E